MNITKPNRKSKVAMNGTTDISYRFFCGRYRKQCRRLELLFVRQQTHFESIQFLYIPCFPDNKSPRKIGPGAVFEDDFNVSPTFKINPI